MVAVINSLAMLHIFLSGKSNKSKFLKPHNEHNQTSKMSLSSKQSKNIIFFCSDPAVRVGISRGAVFRAKVLLQISSTRGAGFYRRDATVLIFKKCLRIFLHNPSTITYCLAKLRLI